MNAACWISSHPARDKSYSRAMEREALLLESEPLHEVGPRHSNERALRQRPEVRATTSYEFVNHWPDRFVNGNCKLALPAALRFLQDNIIALLSDLRSVKFGFRLSHSRVKRELEGLSHPLSFPFQLASDQGNLFVSEFWLERSILGIDVQPAGNVFARQASLNSLFEQESEQFQFEKRRVRFGMPARLLFNLAASPLRVFKNYLARKFSGVGDLFGGKERPESLPLGAVHFERLLFVGVASPQIWAHPSPAIALCVLSVADQRKQLSLDPVKLGENLALLLRVGFPNGSLDDLAVSITLAILDVNEGRILTFIITEDHRETVVSRSKSSSTKKHSPSYGAALGSTVFGIPLPLGCWFDSNAVHFFEAFPLVKLLAQRATVANYRSKLQTTDCESVVFGRSK